MASSSNRRRVSSSGGEEDFARRNGDQPCRFEPRSRSNNNNTRIKNVSSSKGIGAVSSSTAPNFSLQVQFTDYFNSLHCLKPLFCVPTDELLRVKDDLLSEPH